VSFVRSLVLKTVSAALFQASVLCFFDGLFSDCCRTIFSKTAVVILERLRRSLNVYDILATFLTNCSTLIGLPLFCYLCIVVGFVSGRQFACQLFEALSWQICRHYPAVLFHLFQEEERESGDAEREGEHVCLGFPWHSCSTLDPPSFLSMKED